MMKMIELACQKCGGTLSLDIENLYAHCPHCGHKLLFDLEQIEFVLAEREKTKREQEVTKRVQIEAEYNDRKSKRKHDSDFRDTVAVLILLVCMMFFALLMMLIFR